MASLGYYSVNVRNQEYWYRSPFRDERTASFKVNRPLNFWYDHGIGKGGDLIDFGTLYFNCSVTDLLQRLSDNQPNLSVSFHLPTHPGARHPGQDLLVKKKDGSGGKIAILEVRPLTTPYLLSYLQRRCIPLEIANRFCTEVDFSLYGKRHTVIGFQNNSGGYELRSGDFKGSSSPKDITFIDNRSGQIAVFEGLFSFLSFRTISGNQPIPLTNCLILNSLSFFEKSRSSMEQHAEVHLLLDRDTAGGQYTRQALQWDHNKYIDRSSFYHGHKDLNEWLVQNCHSRGEARQMRRRR